MHGRVKHRHCGHYLWLHLYGEGANTDINEVLQHESGGLNQ
jgi:hypothetical protein